MDGEQCPTSQNNNTCKTGCAMHGSCGYHINVRIYTGVTEKKCSPKGCPGDCNHKTTVCYTEYPCKKSNNFYSYTSVCTTMTSPPPPATPQLCYPPCCDDIFPIYGKCFLCEMDEDNPDPHDVDNDSCTE